MAHRFSIGSAEAARLEMWNRGTRWKPTDFVPVAGNHYRMKYKIGGENVEIVLMTYNCKKNGVGYSRACAKCGQRTQERMDTPGDVFCQKNECGGKKIEAKNRLQNAGNKAKRDAQKPALLALMAEYNVPCAPDNIQDAEYDKTYAKLNRENDYKPNLVRRIGNGKRSQYFAWCACKNGGKTVAGRCNICVSKRPKKRKKKLAAFCSECQNVLTPGYDICSGCRDAPVERGGYKQAILKKADGVMEAIAAELKRLGREELIPKITRDCTKRDELTGICSGRREDYDLNSTPRFNINMEVSEKQHKDKTSYSDDCEKRKYTGQLMDRGAPGFTDAEGDIMDREPSDSFLEEVAETDRDTPQYQWLRKQRSKIVERVLRDQRAREREIQRGDASYVPMKMVVVHFNPDVFLDHNGIQQPGLFKELPPDERDGSIRFWPLPALFEAVKPYVAEIVRLHDAALDDNWVDNQVSLSVSKYRYDGCHADGRPAKRRRTLFE